MRFLLRPIPALVGVLIICVASFFLVARFYPFWDMLARPSAWLFERIGKGSTWVHFIVHIGDIQREQQQLRAENEVLLARVGALDALLDENGQLRKALNLPPAVKRRLGDARISAMIFQPGTQTLVIYPGESAISVGDAVISAEGFLIGMVTEVGPGSAFVRLITDPSSQMTVRTIDTDIAGIAQGVLDRGIAMQLVAHAEPVAVEDLIVTAGDDHYPAGIPIGKVSSVRTPAGTLFQDIVIKPFFSFSRMSHVFILRK